MIDVAGRRILVVGINYAPEHTGISPYTTRACEHLTAQGAQVQVLAGVPHYPHWSVPAEYRGRLAYDEERHGVAVRRLRHHVPGQQTALSRGLYELTYALQVWRQKVDRPDAVVAVVPSLLGAAAAQRIARRHRVPLIVWVQDLMGRAAVQSGIAGGGAVAELAGRVEARLLRAADSVVAINEVFREHAIALGVAPERIEVVPNWSHVTTPDRKPSAVRQELGWRDDQVIALHTGNMGLKQDLGNVVAAARHASESGSDVHFVLMGDGNQRADLVRSGADVPNLHFLPPADDAEYSNVLAAADVLLVNERPTAVDMSLPSKLTSYFRAGMPVVAAVPEDGGTAREVRRSGAGVVVAPAKPDALHDTVRGLGTNQHLRHRLSRAALSYASEHLSEHAALQRLTRVVHRGLQVEPAPAGLLDWAAEVETEYTAHAAS